VGEAEVVVEALSVVEPVPEGVTVPNGKSELDADRNLEASGTKNGAPAPQNVSDAHRKITKSPNSHSRGLSKVKSRRRH
jgi:hypothetical protein